ncbi:FHA domain-containing protein [Actinomadura sp. WMMB 499]|uniref:FHA domain-containing protein n=1 Tax=Actinomadura sp. WMMB 499 TaxID=1219491 RepID=UPI001246C791|nr:FHA domain-containing protein [Actinomadura sp. WMMB 499]QFG22825.1 FHA domain-containing protein [Actinomadura sp. WMMB 499]
MPECPIGHRSEDAEYCDVCGRPMDATPALGEGAAGFCGNCGTARSPDALFCENCGTRFGDPRDAARGASGRQAPPHRDVPHIPRPRDPVSAPQGWIAVINADRAYFNSVIAELGAQAPDLEFPPYCPERRIPLRDGEVWIGRRSESRGIMPAIDLGEAPADPGVSHLHAVLNARSDGTWTLTDHGSQNGTTMNGEVEILKARTPVPVGDGDRIHVGAWTTITLTRQGGP